MSVLLLLCFSLSAAEEDVWKNAKLLVLNDVWEKVNSSYYDETFGGNDWKAIGEAYRKRLPEIGNLVDLRKLIREMLNELGDSHFAILQGQFTNLSKKERFSGALGDVGIELTLIENELYVFRLDENGAGRSVGLREGMRIKKLGKQSFKKLRNAALDYGLPRHLEAANLLAIAESQLSLIEGEKIRIKAGYGSWPSKSYLIEALPYEGKRSAKIGHMSAMPVEFESKQLRDGIAYIRFNLWLPVLMNEIRPYLTELSLNADGLIIDIRGNRGGLGMMAAGVAGLLVEEKFSMGTMALRSGHMNFIAYPQKNAFLGPVAVLIDDNTLSTSEIFAAALQENGRVRVFGTTSSGATLPSQFMELVNGDVMQVPLADFVTAGGTRIEGIGVLPDQEVGLSPKKLINGTDTVIEAARLWLLEKLANK
ncbi:S41 family peptidase [Puniceicoccaceae bacterium K14]|nr:S41 family peptidase [Puniceicoccaceae bacterium K14]